MEKVCGGAGGVGQAWRENWMPKYSLPEPSGDNVPPGAVWGIEGSLALRWTKNLKAIFTFSDKALPLAYWQQLMNITFELSV